MTTIEQESKPDYIKFWIVKRSKDGTIKNIEFDSLQLLDLLNSMGFRVFRNGTIIETVYLRNGEIQNFILKDAVKMLIEHLESYPDDMIEQGLSKHWLTGKILDNISFIFKNQKMQLLPEIDENDFIQDNRN